MAEGDITKNPAPHWKQTKWSARSDLEDRLERIEDILEQVVLEIGTDNLMDLIGFSANELDDGLDTD